MHLVWILSYFWRLSHSCKVQGDPMICLWSWERLVSINPWSSSWGLLYAKRCVRIYQHSSISCKCQGREALNSTNESGNSGPCDSLLENLSETNFYFRLKSDQILFFNMQERVSWTKYPARMLRHIVAYKFPCLPWLSFWTPQEDNWKTVKNRYMSDYHSPPISWTPA